MNVLLKSLGIEGLGIEDRLALIEELWDSIAADNASVHLTQVQRAELDRRIAERDGNPHDVVSWVVVKAAISER